MPQAKSKTPVPERLWSKITHQYVLITMGMGIVTAGLIIVVATATWALPAVKPVMVAQLQSKEPACPSTFWGPCLSVVGLIHVLWGVFKAMRIYNEQEHSSKERTSVSYARSLIGVCYAVFLLAILSLVSFAGLANEPFDAAKFWGRGAYRCGQAVIFTIVFLLVFMRDSEVTTAKWLPIAALVTGMFVETGERVVFGLAQRILDAVGSLVAGSTPKSGGKSEVIAGS